VLVSTAIVSVSKASELQATDAGRVQGGVDSLSYFITGVLLLLPPLAIFSPLLGILAIAGSSPATGRYFALANLQSMLPAFVTTAILVIRSEYPSTAKLGAIVGMLLPLLWIGVKIGLVFLIRASVAVWDSWRQSGHITEVIGPAVGLAHRLNAIRGAITTLTSGSQQAMRSPTFPNGMVPESGSLLRSESDESSITQA